MAERGIVGGERGPRDGHGGDASRRFPFADLPALNASCPNTAEGKTLEDRGALVPQLDALVGARAALGSGVRCSSGALRQPPWTWTAAPRTSSLISPWSEALSPPTMTFGPERGLAFEPDPDECDLLFKDFRGLAGQLGP